MQELDLWSWIYSTLYQFSKRISIEFSLFMSKSAELQRGSAKWTCKQYWPRCLIKLFLNEGSKGTRSFWIYRVGAERVEILGGMFNGVRLCGDESVTWTGWWKKFQQLQVIINLNCDLVGPSSSFKWKLTSLSQIISYSTSLQIVDFSISIRSKFFERVVASLPGSTSRLRSTRKQHCTVITS